MLASEYGDLLLDTASCFCGCVKLPISEVASLTSTAANIQTTQKKKDHPGGQMWCGSQLHNQAILEKWVARGRWFVIHCTAIFVMCWDGGNHGLRILVLWFDGRNSRPLVLHQHGVVVMIDGDRGHGLCNWLGVGSHNENSGFLCGKKTAAHGGWSHPCDIASQLRMSPKKAIRVTTVSSWPTPQEIPDPLDCGSEWGARGSKGCVCRTRRNRCSGCTPSCRTQR